MVKPESGSQTFHTVVAQKELTEFILKSSNGTNVERNVYQKKSSAKSLLAVIGVAALGALGAWQFYLFVTFRDSQGAVDVQGGTVHLWLPIGIALIVCIAGIFLFSRFLRYDTRNEIHITSADPSLTEGRIVENVL